MCADIRIQTTAGLPAIAAQVIFAAGRTPGCVAHALEQMSKAN
jgi:citrate synthase